jgi:predicted nucleotide-binding protein (sugar kinase/HSP70/actin superfamily)
MTAASTSVKTTSVRQRLAGRTLWIPRMTPGGARLMAAVFRSIGLDAQVTPPSDERTLELGGLYSGGEECYPQKVTLGDFLRIIQSPGFRPEGTAFFMPTAEGPCRFGQYAPYLKQVLNELGYGDVPVISPTSRNSYDGFTEHAPDMIRRMWWGLVASDILLKLLLRTRPYETRPGDTDETYEQSLQRLEQVCQRPDLKGRPRFSAVLEALTQARDLFRGVPARYRKDRPLIGVVGEIFCRLNDFSNRDAVRRIEAHGGEGWISDVSEWVWYTNWSQRSLLRDDGKSISPAMLAAVIKNKVQRHDERRLYAPFAEDLVGYEEPHDLYQEVLKRGWPYLPANGALGEMVLSVGKSVYLYHKGADGIIDISPFSCMNGIVSEAVYHAISRDHDGIPIRNFYFDATTSNMERDLDIFIELSLAYRRRKRRVRRYPACFGQTGPAAEMSGIAGGDQRI